MKKLILTIMILASFQAFALDGQDGGGGGVIKRDGMYLTFGSAGMKIKLDTPQGLEQIPSLELMLSVIDAQSGVPTEFRGQMVNALLPSNVRRYFKINPSQLGSSTYARLIAEYSKLWNGQISSTNLDLAAITIENDTFLLPPYFHLKPAEQAAILFHESVWTIKPDIKYSELVNVEMTVQAHIEKYGLQKVYNPDLMAAFGKIFNNSALIVAMALKEDIRAGNLHKIVQRTEVVRISKRKTQNKIVQVNEYANLNNLIPRALSASSKVQQGELVLGLREAIKNYPKSITLKVLYSLRTQIETIWFYGSGSGLSPEELINQISLNRDYTGEVCSKGAGISVCFAGERQ